MADSWERISYPPPPLFYDDTLILPTPLFKFLANHLFRLHQPSPNWFLWYLSSLAEWVIMSHFMCYLTYLYYGFLHIDLLYLPTRRTLLCFFLQQGIKCTETWDIMLFYAGILIWYHAHITTAGLVLSAAICIIFNG